MGLCACQHHRTPCARQPDRTRRSEHCFGTGTPRRLGDYSRRRSPPNTICMSARRYPSLAATIEVACSGPYNKSRLATGSTHTQLSNLCLRLGKRQAERLHDPNYAWRVSRHRTQPGSSSTRRSTWPFRGNRYGTGAAPLRRRLTGTFTAHADKGPRSNGRDTCCRWRYGRHDLAAS